MHGHNGEVGAKVAKPMSGYEWFSKTVLEIPFSIDYCFNEFR
jgi:hypothetical protein